MISNDELFDTQNYSPTDDGSAVYCDECGTMHGGSIGGRCADEQCGGRLIGKRLHEADLDSKIALLTTEADAKLVLLGRTADNREHMLIKFARRAMGAKR